MQATQLTSSRKPPAKPRVLILWNETEESESTPHASIAEEELRLLSQALRDDGFTVADVNAEDDTDRVGHAVVVERPTVLFNLVDHFYGDDTQHPSFAALLDLFGYQYTGSDPTALATCQNRARTRVLLAGADIPVPRFVTVWNAASVPPTDALRFPVMVSHAHDDLYNHPAERTLLGSRDEVLAKLSEVGVASDPPLLVEEYIEGDTISAVLIGNRELEVLPLCVHHVPTGSEEPIIDGAELSEATATQIRQLARRVFAIMGCRDVVQVDFVVAPDGTAYCTDVRPCIDYLSETGVFRAAARLSERGYAGTLAHVARTAYARVPAAERPDAPRPAPTAASATAEPTTAAASAPSPSDDGASGPPQAD